MARVVPNRWGTASACPALGEYDQYPKSGEDRRGVSIFFGLVIQSASKTAATATESSGNTTDVADSPRQ